MPAALPLKQKSLMWHVSLLDVAVTNKECLGMPDTHCLEPASPVLHVGPSPDRVLQNILQESECS